MSGSERRPRSREELLKEYGVAGIWAGEFVPPWEWRRGKR